jgi:hypothetical protein
MPQSSLPLPPFSFPPVPVPRRTPEPPYVDTVDLKLLAQIWSHSPDVTFIYPLGEEHGFDAIEQHVFEKVMGGMFSARPQDAWRDDLCERQRRVVRVSLGFSCHTAQRRLGGHDPWRRESGLPQRGRTVASRPRALLRGPPANPLRAGLPGPHRPPPNHRDRLAHPPQIYARAVQQRGESRVTRRPAKWGTWLGETRDARKCNLAVGLANSVGQGSTARVCDIEMLRKNIGRQGPARAFLI